MIDEMVEEGSEADFARNWTERPASLLGTVDGNKISHLNWLGRKPPWMSCDLKSEIRAILGLFLVLQFIYIAQ